MDYETGYYWVVQDSEESWNRERGYVTGRLVYVLASNNSLHVLFNGYTSEYDCNSAEHMAEFAEKFRLEPNGRELRQQQIVTLMDELAKAQFESQRVQTQLANFRPHSEGEEFVTGTEIIPAVGGMVSAKKAVATLRNEIMKKSKNMELKTKQLQGFLDEQKRVLDIQLKSANALLEKAEEAIWSINLYLGKNEDIHILRQGKPAPAEDKIVLRQKVLYMDEECAQQPHDNPDYALQGIDVDSIRLFDEWLLADERHLRQVLYERKGIVALHIKRNSKDYGDPWVNKEKNIPNRCWTYFLIRNGENVYRVFVDINAGERLFPRSDSFSNWFEGLKPGSEQYMKAMESAEAINRHYMCVLLVLQGLLDRTVIFKPMPVSRINICDFAQSLDYVEFVYDDEKVLTDGRPTFDRWQEAANANLAVGHRIMGVFDYRLRGNKKEYVDSRIWPENATYPQKNVLYLIDEVDGEKYIFHYDRKEQILNRDPWSYNLYKDSENRARCWLLKNDEFYLDFDAVTIEELRYYATHRQSRHLYNDMIPLLQVAIDLKEEEAAQEAPFRSLLVAQIAQAHGVDLAEVDESVDELITWWKLKNRNHRALVSDDKKALEMIVHEFGLRQERKNKAERYNLDEVKKALLGAVPDALLIAHKKANEFVVLVPSNAYNVFVTEQLWTIRGHKITCKMAKKWTTVTKSFTRWDVIHRSDRWDGWNIHPIRTTVLTDPELAELAEKSIAVRRRCNSSEERFLPLAVQYDPQSFEFTLLYTTAAPKIPALLVSGGRIDGPVLKKMKIAWKKTREGVTLTDTGYPSQYSSPIDEMLKERNDRKNFRVWEENVALFRRESDEEKLAEKTSGRLRYQYNYVEKQLDEIMAEKIVAEERRKFDEEYGDPELWDDHLKMLHSNHKIRKVSAEPVRVALSYYAERILDPVGKTVAEVLTTANNWRAQEPEEKDSWGRKYKTEMLTVPKECPLDFVIPPLPVEEDDSE